MRFAFNGRAKTHYVIITKLLIGHKAKSMKACATSYTRDVTCVNQPYLAYFPFCIFMPTSTDMSTNSEQIVFG